MAHKITTREKVFYGIGGLGENMIFALSSTFLLPFFTDVLGIGAGVAGTIFLIARIWDAINDPIMGTLVDKTKTRWGKMRPYLLFAALPVCILTILSFCVPDIGRTQKTVYAVIVYILWGMAFTICDIPYNGLSSTLSSSTTERTKLLSFSKILVAIGTGIPVLLVPLMVPLFGGGDGAKGYLITTILISVVGMGLFLFAFFGTKERVHTTGEKITVGKIFKTTVKNKPLLLLVSSGILASLRYLPQSAGMYFATYNLGNQAFFTILGAVIIGSTIFSIMLTPLLLKKLSKRDLYVYSSIFGAVVAFIMYFVGYQSIPVICILLFLECLPIGIFNILLPAMIADSVDYGEWKTGQRTEGVCFAGSSFIFKVTSGLTAFITGIVLSAVGFVEGQPTQTDEVLHGIFLLVTILPAIGGLLCCIPMMFYKFTEDVQRQAVAEIEKRKAHREDDSDVCDDESSVDKIVPKLIDTAPKKMKTSLMPTSKHDDNEEK